MPTPQGHCSIRVHQQVRWGRFAVAFAITALLAMPRLRSDDEQASVARVAIQSGVIVEHAALSVPGTVVEWRSHASAQACSNAACHGNLNADDSTDRIRFDEYHVWTDDAHSRASRALTNARSNSIFQRLGLVDANWAIREGRQALFDKHMENCRGCHDTSAGRDEQGKLKWLNEGVSCEACHGESSNWLDQHYRTGWKSPRSGVDGFDVGSGRAGALNLDHPVVQASICASCHVGGRGEVNHDLIAAGHPAMKYEFSWYRSRMPAHWKPNRSNRSTAPTFDDQTAWIIGQIVGAEVAVDQLRLRTMQSSEEQFLRTWPEFAEYGCFACHHDLEGENSWRQENGFVTQPTTNSNPDKVLIPWAPWEMQLIEELARNDESAAAQSVSESLQKLRQLMNASLVPDRGAVRSQVGKTKSALAAWRSQFVEQDSRRTQEFISRFLQSESHEWSLQSWEKVSQLFLALAAPYREQPNAASSSLVELGQLLRSPTPSAVQYDSPRQFRGLTGDSVSPENSNREKLRELIERLTTTESQIPQ